MGTQTPTRPVASQSQTNLEPNTQYKQTRQSKLHSIFDTIPIPLVLFLAKPYLAGETAQDALELAQKLFREEQFSSTLDILGEDAHNDADCDASVDQYKRLIDLISRNPLPVKEVRKQPTVSFKPSMFCTRAPEAGQYRGAELDKAFNRIESIVDFASARNVNVTLEAEDHRWTDFHLETYFALIEGGYRNFGTVLQTRMFRTESDIKRFDERMRTRLVLGIYNEPADIALTDKALMKEQLIKLSAKLLERCTYVEVASHDTGCIDKFLQQVVLPNNISTKQFETQYLHGVPRKRYQKTLINGTRLAQLQHAQKTASQGVLVRMYLPFGEGRVAGAYCRRRLKENPNMAIYGIKNLLGLDA